MLAKGYKGPVLIIKKHKQLSSESLNNILLRNIKKLKPYIRRSKEELIDLNVISWHDYLAVGQKTNTFTMLGVRLYTTNAYITIASLK